MSNKFVIFLVVAKDNFEEYLPSFDSFSGPDPDSSCNADCQGHEVSVKKLNCGISLKYIRKIKST